MPFRARKDETFSDDEEDEEEIVVKRVRNRLSEGTTPGITLIAVDEESKSRTIKNEWGRKASSSVCDEQDGSELDACCEPKTQSKVVQSGDISSFSCSSSGSSRRRRVLLDDEEEEDEEEGHIEEERKGTKHIVGRFNRSLSATKGRRASFLSKDGRVSEDEEGSEDLDDFIVPDDYEEDDEWDQHRRDKRRRGGVLKSRRTKSIKDTMKKDLSSRSRRKRKSTYEEEEEEEEEEGRYRGDMSDFVVDDDYVEMMDEKGSRSSAKQTQTKRDRAPPRAKGQRQPVNKEHGREEGRAGREAAPIKVRASETAHRRKIVLDSDDEDNESPAEYKGGDRNGARGEEEEEKEEEEEQEEQEKEEEEEEEEEEGEEEEDDSESSVDETLMHMRAYAKMALEEEERMPLFMTRRKMSLREAFALYVEMLASSLADPDFRSGMRRHPTGQVYGRFSNAKKFLEDQLCTRRESLLGSMQWRPLWVEELRSRPRFQWLEAIGERPDRCMICGRRRHPCAFQVLLSGPRYDSRALWESRNWESALPCSVEALGTPEEAEEERRREEEWEEEEARKREEKGEEEEEERVREGRSNGWWDAGSTCQYKSLCYSRMTHYKYCLLRRIARRLKGFATGGARSRRGQRAREGGAGGPRPRRNAAGSWAVVLPVAELMQEAGWVEAEFERMKTLLDLVEGMMMDKRASASKTLERIEHLWSDEEGGGFAGWQGEGQRREKREDKESEEEDKEEGLVFVPGRRGYNPLV